MPTVTPPPPTIPESNQTEAAYKRVKPSLAAVPDAELEVKNVDLDKVGQTGYALAEKCVTPEIWAELVQQPPKQFAAAEAIAELANLSLAASWVATLGLSARAGTSEVMLPKPLVQNAMTLKNRMLATCVYCLDDNATAMVEISSIRSGGGYVDLKHDLRRLAILYRAYAGELSGKKYDAADEAQALALADEINVYEDGEQSAEQLLTERRIWTLLKAKADRAYEAAVYVTHHLPQVRATIRSIHTWREVGRAKKPEDAPQPPPSGTQPIN